jgi:hypothetical protein
VRERHTHSERDRERDSDRWGMTVEKREVEREESRQIRGSGRAQKYDILINTLIPKSVYSGLSNAIAMYSLTVT